MTNNIPVALMALEEILYKRGGRRAQPRRSSRQNLSTTEADLLWRFQLGTRSRWLAEEQTPVGGSAVR
jgi:hypothetical protein